MTDTTTPEPVAPVSDMVERRAIEIVAQTMRDMGLIEEDVEAYIANPRDGDDGIATQAVERALASIRTPEAAQVEMRMAMFLEILSAAGGEADASDSSWNWINAFCEEHEKRDPDTFNSAINAGYVRWSHDSDSDCSTVSLTDKGRGALAQVRASGEEEVK